MKKTLFLLSLSICFMLSLTSCDVPSTPSTPSASSGVQKQTTKVQTDLNGQTVEQRNIINRYAMDNKPGSIKHLYIISAYSGQVLIYSTVKGKVTSSNKRLDPSTVVDGDGEYYTGSYGFNINIGGQDCRTTEVLGADGTYGSSMEYLYWWDSKDVYHQQYVTGGMILHISSEPIAVKSVIINMETNN